MRKSYFFSSLLEDYLRVDQPEVDDSAREVVSAVVAAEPSIKLEEVFLEAEGVASRDEIYQLIATGDVYVDLNAAPIVEPNQVRVFPNKETAIAMRTLWRSRRMLWQTTHDSSTWP